MRPNRKSTTVPTVGVEDALRAFLSALPQPQPQAEPQTGQTLAYTIEEAAEHLRISRAGMCRLMKRGEIIPSRLGRRCTRIPQEELLRYLRSKQVA